MPPLSDSSKGIDNPWYPEGGPGRHLKARLNRGDVLIGATLEAYAHPSLVKMFRHAGFDFLYIEYEHSLFDLQDLADTILSARDNGMPVIAKTPQLERQEVSKLLEAGVVGIQLPRTETREQVERLLSYLKFPPAGTRAVAPGWGNSDYREVVDWRGWMDEQDQETTLVVHLETVRGYRNAEEILSLPGVDMCFVGPGDTSIEFGHPGDFDHPEVRGPMEDVLKRCKKHGVAFGTMPWSAAAAGDWARRGAAFYEATSELGFIRAGAAALVEEYRAQLVSRPGNS
ncbi:MAG: aldolase/citrate lyase family protein [Gemmatimonadetes bacterium]|nr:aldolase/citrate lyase family protein [Gemmatimonadota bacterium]